MLAGNDGQFARLAGGARAARARRRRALRDERAARREPRRAARALEARLAHADARRVARRAARGRRPGRAGADDRRGVLARRGARARRRSTRPTACARSRSRRTSPRRPRRRAAGRPTSTSTATRFAARSAATDVHRRAGAPQQRRERAALVGPLDRGRERSSSAPSTAARIVDVRADDLVALPFDLVHHDRAVHVEPRRRRARLVSSLASDIVRQPACAAASSSSGLVLPSASRDPRRQRERQLAERARLGRRSALAARDVPFPDRRLQSVRSSASQLLLSVGRRGCRRGNRPRPGEPAGRKTPSRRSSVSPVFARQWTSARRQVDARAGAQLAPLAADVQRALALEDVDHLVVGVEVVGRAARRHEADELRRPRRSRSRASRRARTAARRWPCPSPPRSGRARRGSPTRAAGRARAPRPHAPRPRRSRRCRGDEHRGAGPQRMRLAADRGAPRAFEHVEHLVGAGRGARAGERDDALREEADVEERPSLASVSCIANCIGL